jgi:hypothetical protein
VEYSPLARGLQHIFKDSAGMIGAVGTEVIQAMCLEKGTRLMKRLLITALVAGVFSVFGLAGSSEKSEVQTQEKVSAPGGTTTTTDTKEIKSSGENPPPNSAGQTAETPK